MSNKKSSKQTKKDDEEFRPNNESIDESMSGVERANKTKRKASTSLDENIDLLKKAKGAPKKIKQAKKSTTYAQNLDNEDSMDHLKPLSPNHHWTSGVTGCLDLLVNGHPAIGCNNLTGFFK